MEDRGRKDKGDKYRDRLSKYKEFMPGNCHFSKLIERGFFNAPASSTHHGNYEGGLFDHSFDVAEQLVLLTTYNGKDLKALILLVCFMICVK